MQMIWVQQFFLSMTFLTRVAMPVRGDAGAMPLAQCIWAFPLVGMFVGLSCAMIYLVCLLLSISPLIAGLLTLLFQVVLTGGLHEDGLADTADGLGGRDQAHKLAIMHDSRIGSYGVLALVLFMSMRAQSLAGFVNYAPTIWGFMAAGAISRSVMGIMMYLLPPVKVEGLAAGAGRPSVAQAVAAAAISFIPLAGFGDMYIFIVCVCVATITLVMAADYIRRHFGGITGDLLGAVQVVTETFLLITLAVCLRN
jgi:adenosylcobinamide-GDP ribazoletransferase